MKHSKIFRILGVALTLALLIAVIPAGPALALTGNIAVFPASGPPGSTPYVSGNGFTPSSTATVYFTTTPVAFGQVNGSGIFNIPFVVPLVARGNFYAVTVVTNAPDSSNVALFQVVPQINVGSTAGEVGDQVTVSGDGFQASLSVDILFDDTVVATVTATPAGIIGNTTFTVPPSAQGAHEITGKDAIGSTPGVNYTVSPTMTVAPTEGGVNDQVTVSGQGFADNDTITISFDGAAVATSPATVTTNSVGSFAATFIVPNAGQGDHTVKAQDVTGNFVTATFAIGQSMSITPTLGLVGDLVTVSGTGFDTAKIVTITFGGVVVTTTPAVITTGNGSFSATFIVPSAAKGAHTVKAEDASGNSGTATYSVQHIMAMEPAEGKVGDQVTVSGSGFAGSSPITIFFDNVNVGTAITAADGSFTGATFNVPVSAKGTHTVKIQDASGNSDTATFTTGETMAISPASGFVGDQIAAIGTGFGANRSLTFYIDNESVGATTTDANGSFSGIFIIPASANGDHTVRALDSVGNSATATVATRHSMSITPNTGVAGTVVAVSGSGFGGSRQITITFNGQVVATTPTAIVTGTDGNFAAGFLLPASPAGSYTVEVSDGTNSDSATVTTERTSSISPTTLPNAPGYVGLEMTISGAGFKADTTVTVTYLTGPVVLATTTTDSSGSFSVTFNIPASAGGDHTITVSDGVTTEEFAFIMESIAPVPPVPLLPPLDFKPKQPITFDWQDVGDASSPLTYRLQIARDEAFNDIALEKTGLTESQYILTEEEKLDSVSGKEPYRWRVRATDSAGNVSLWSGIGTFTVGFAWPGWIIHLWYGLGILAAAGIGFWVGRKTLMSSY